MGNQKFLIKEDCANGCKVTVVGKFRDLILPTIDVDYIDRFAEKNEQVSKYEPIKLKKR